MKPNELKFGHFYIVEVSFNKHNPIHRAIAFDTRSGGYIKLLGGGYEPDVLEINISDLEYFNIIEEIQNLNPTTWSWKLPKDAKETNLL